MKYKIGIIDDDPIISATVSAVLRSHFADLEIETFEEPVIFPALDIYFIDNQFNGECYIENLLKEIREINPNALVIAMSATLNLELLERLMNNGCNATWNKKWEKREEILDIIQEYMNTLKRERDVQSKGVNGSFHALRDLLSQWNKRLHRGS